MEVIRHPYRSDIPRLRELWDACFGETPTFLDWFFSERFDPDYSLCMAVDDRIVSVAHGYPMPVSFGRCSVPALIVGGVTTEPPFRGRGYMFRLLQALFRIARGNGIPLVFNTPVREGMYAHLDMLPVTMQRTVITANEAAPLALHPNLLPDLSELLACYAYSLSPYVGSVCRDAHLMRLRVQDYLSDNGQFLCERNSEGRLIGYCFVLPRREEDSLYVPEIVADNVETYQKLLDRLPIHTCVKLPPDIPISGTVAPQSVMRTVDAARLLQLVPFPDDTDAICIKDTVLPENEGIFTLHGEPSSTDPMLTLSSGELVQKLLGYPNRLSYCIEEY